ncbi:hypothetical protein ABIE33_003199 [Ensifer sp. 4252]
MAASDWDGGSGAAHLYACWIAKLGHEVRLMLGGSGFPSHLPAPTKATPAVSSLPNSPAIRQRNVMV